jgi:hypothetical protein
MTDDAAREFEERLRASKLVAGDELLMPSFVDALGELELGNAIDLARLITDQSLMYQRFLEEHGYDIAPQEFVGFVIPLDSYVPPRRWLSGGGIDSPRGPGSWKRQDRSRRWGSLIMNQLTLSR